MTRSALYLLRNLPPSREAILEFYSGMLDESAGLHFKDGEVLEIPGELPSLLSGFLSGEESSPETRESWAPLISRWSLNLLGELSRKYWNHISRADAADMNQVLAIWLTCSPTKILIDLTSQCFRCLMSAQNEATNEATVASLIDTSLRYGSHFDWVVAHIGGCFPQTVIHKVLYVGLKNFYGHVSTQQNNEGFKLSQISELDSVIGIIDHLAANHDSVLRNALQSMTRESFDNIKFNKANSIEIATIPYLLYLSSLSPIVSGAFTSDINLFLHKSDIVEKVTKSVPKWNKSYFNENRSLIKLVQNLIMNNRENGADILKIILEIVEENESGNSGQGCKILMETLITSTVSEIHNLTTEGGEIPLLISVADNLQIFLDKFILSNNIFVQNSAITIISCTALKIGKGVSIRTIKHCITHANNDSQLGVLLRYIREIEMWQPGVVASAVEQSLKSKKTKPLPLMENLIRIIEYERQSNREIVLLTNFSSIIVNRQSDLLGHLSRKELVPRILRILELVPVDAESCLTVSLMHRVIQCCVHTMFTVLSETYDKEEKLMLVFKIEAILSKLSNHHLGLPMVLRFMMEGALQSPYASCFGGKYEPDPDNLKGKKSSQNVRLMDQNMKFGSMPTYPVGATTVYHAGIIGNGAKYLNTKDDNPKLSNEATLENRTLFVSVLFKLCQMESKEKAKESTRQLSLLLVDIVSPDVMYNGLPWPEEEFTKVTIERDLKIKKTFENHPLLWPIMFGLAEARPALCYSSVLLRALFAVILAHWQSSVAKVASDNPKQLQQTCKILKVMAIGQFLPHPLDSVSDILSILEPFHVHCILTDIWNYMRDHVPTPVSYNNCSSNGLMSREFEPFKNYKSYCERLRLIMLKHLKRLSGEYKRFFVDVASKNKEESINIAMEY